MENAWDFWDMTPREIEGRITARNKQQDETAMNYDFLAWAVGLYAGRSYHQPKKYPNKPDIIDKRKQRPDKTPPQEQGEQMIKDMLTVFAETHNAAEGVI